MKHRNRSLNLNEVLTVIIILLSTSSMQGQVKTDFTLSGQVVDSATRQPIADASVALYKPKGDIFIAGTITNSKGQFAFKNLAPGNYLIKCSFVGYKGTQVRVEILDKPVILSEPIALQESSVILQGVSVSGKQSERQVSIEKTRINVAQNIGSVSGNVTDVLKSQPSVTIDSGDKIYLRGNANILILVDGKPSTLTSLNSIPAASVENIEIITNPDAKYDSEGTGGIINIITRRTSTNGLSGNLTLNFGLPSRGNGGLNIGYAGKKWDIGFSYSGRLEKNSIASSLSRELYAQNIETEQEVHSIQKNYSNNAAVSFSFRPSPKDLILLNTKLAFPNVANSQEITGTSFMGTSSSSVFNRINEVQWLRKLFESTASYKRIIAKNKHELSFDLLFSRTRGSRPADYFIEGEWLQKSDAGGAPTNMSLQSDYFRPIVGSGRMEIGLKAFYRMNNFNSHFYDLDTLTEQWILNPLYSNDLEHKEYIYSGYMMYSDTLLRKLYYKIGVRMEYNISDFKQLSTNDELYRTWFFPFPYLLAKYNLNSSSNIALSLSRRISRPTYGQLNPFIIVIDQITYETGNKSLEPETLDKLEVNYSLFKEKYQIKTNAFFSQTAKYISQVSLLSSGNNLVVTYVNGDRQIKAGIDVDATLKLAERVSLNSAASLFYSSATGMVGQTDLSARGFAWTGNIKATVKPAKSTEVQLLFNYNSPIALPQFNLEEIFYADIAVRRMILKDRLSVSLTLSDIFNTRTWIINSDNTIYRLYNTSKTDTRILWFGISYNLSSQGSAKPVKSENPEADNSVIKLGY